MTTFVYEPVKYNYKLPQGGDDGDYLVKEGGDSYNLAPNSFSDDVEALIEDALESITGDVTITDFVSAIGTGVIVDDDINASAAIALTKLAPLPVAGRALISDGSGFITTSTTLATELAYVGGVTSSIQTQLNGKQPTGNYITALTGDATASGPGSAALTLATVNSNVGSFGSATQVGTFTVNAKGLITAAANASIQIAESQVTNLVSDLAAKQPLDATLTALAGLSGTGFIVETGTDTFGYGYPYTLTDYGGANFNGSSTYYNANALTGISDSKLFHLVLSVRFANAASSSERLVDATSSNFFIVRLNTGNFQISAKNAAGTFILSLVTNTAVAAAAGAYIIEVSCNMAGAYTMKVNGVIQTFSTATITNDTIKFTSAQYLIGTNIALTQYFNGDFYLLYLNVGVAPNITLDNESRKFYDVNLVPNFLGQNGELVTGTPPDLFLAYDKSDAWDRNKGLRNSTAFTRNGTIADAVVPLSGRDGGRIPRTITAMGTTGAQTIHKRAGSVNFAAAAASLVVTNRLVSQYSVVLCQIRTVDLTMTSVVVSVANGSFTLTPNTAPTAETRVDFVVHN